MLVGQEKATKTRSRTYFQQIPHVPLFADHVVVRFAASNLGWLAVHENLLDDEAHAAETVGVAILPDGVVVDLVNAVDERYLMECIELEHFKSE